MINDLSKLTEVRECNLRSTGLSDFEKCPRYFLFRHRAGLVPKGQRSAALFRGEIMHGLLASRLGGMSANEAERLARTTMGAYKESVLATVTAAGYTPSGQTPEEAVASIESETKVAIAMSRAYCKFFDVGSGHVGGMNVFEGLIEEYVEESGISGQLDAVVLDETRNELYVLDHKTTGIDPVQYARTLPLTAQTALYPRLLHARVEPDLGIPEEGPLTIAGIIYNIIRTPTIRCCKTDDFNLDRYAERVEKWYEDNPQTTMIQTVIRPSAELRRLSEPRLARGRDACTALPVLENFPATGGTACTAYNSVCPFMGLCTRDTAGWPEELKRYDREFRDEQETNNE